MAGSPPKPPPPTFAAGSSSPKPPAPTLYRHPSYEKLMDVYLRQRVASDTKVDFIQEADLYSADPYQLTENHLPVTARSGEKAWYFFTTLRAKGSTKTQMNRKVDTGREGTWVSLGGPNDVLSKGQLIGHRRYFTFDEKVDGNLLRTPWRMMELRLDPNEGGQEEGSSELLALCKVYESSMAVAKVDAEAPAAPAVATPGPKEADEEIGAETAAGPGRKRKAGDKDSGAETMAASPGRQKKADGERESADAATTGEIFADSKDPLNAAEKAEQDEPGVPRDTRFYNFFGDSSAPLDPPEEAEQEPRGQRSQGPPYQFRDFFSDSQDPKKQ